MHTDLSTLSLLPNELTLNIIERLDWNRNGGLACFSATSRANRTIVTSSPIFQVFLSFHSKNPVSYLSKINLASLNYKIVQLKIHNSFSSRLYQLDPNGNKTNQLLRQVWKEERFENVIIDLLPYLRWIPQAFYFSKKASLQKIAIQAKNLFRLAEKIPNLTADELDQFKAVKYFSSALTALHYACGFYEDLKAKISKKRNVDYLEHQALVKQIIENKLHYDIHLFAPDLLKDRDMVKYALLNGHKHIFEYATLFQGDREIAALAMQINGALLQYASDDLKDDEEIVILAACSGCVAFKYASSRLISDVQFFWKIYHLFEREKNPYKNYLIKYFDKSLKANEDLLLELVNLSPNCLKDGSITVNNKTIALVAIRRNPNNFNYISEQLKSDLDVVEAMLESYQNNGLTSLDVLFIHLDPSIQTNLKLIAKFIEVNLYLSSIADIYKTNRDIFLCLVKKNGILLQFASSEIQKDFEVVLAAVTQNGLALQYTDTSLQSDPEIIEAALTQNIEAFKFVASEIKSL